MFNKRVLVLLTFLIIPSVNAVNLVFDENGGEQDAGVSWTWEITLPTNFETVEVTVYPEGDSSDIGKYTKVTYQTELEWNNNDLWAYSREETIINFSGPDVTTYYYDDYLLGMEVTEESGKDQWIDVTQFCYGGYNWADSLTGGYGIKVRVTTIPLKEDGESCTDPDECLGGFCVNNLCASSSEYCGDGSCNYGEGQGTGEDCHTCPEDCMESGQVCCWNSVFQEWTLSSGDCCENADCIDGYYCDSHTCKIIPSCGDGTCSSGENCQLCEEDCGCDTGECCSPAYGGCIPDGTNYGYSPYYYICCSGTSKQGDCCDNSDCSSEEECVNNNCVNPNLGSEGDTCSTVDDCNTDYCLHGVCRGESTYCGDSFCDNGETYGNCAEDCPLGEIPSTLTFSEDGGTLDGGLVNYYASPYTWTVNIPPNFKSVELIHYDTSNNTGKYLGENVQLRVGNEIIWEVLGWSTAGDDTVYDYTTSKQTYESAGDGKWINATTLFSSGANEVTLVHSGGDLGLRIKVITGEMTEQESTVMKRNIGESCNYSSECKTLNCHYGICCASGKECCNKNWHCSSGYCNLANYYCAELELISNGGTCLNLTECESGNCKNYVCCDTGRTCCSIDYYCIFSLGIGYVCDLKNYYCIEKPVTKKGDGGACTSSDECVGGYCVHGLCWSEPTICGDDYCDSGETCSSCSDDCLTSGVCCNGVLYDGESSCCTSLDCTNLGKCNLKTHKCENVTFGGLNLQILSSCPGGSSMNNAESLALNSEKKLLTSFCKNSGWFKITIPSTGELTVITSSNTGNSQKMYLYDNKGSEVCRDESGVFDWKCDVPVVREDYYLKISYLTEFSSAYYALKTSFFGTCSSNADCGADACKDKKRTYGECLDKQCELKTEFVRCCSNNDCPYEHECKSNECVPVTECGNNKCELGETCATCAKDCDGNGYKCCDGVKVIGECCSDTDCVSGEECLNNICVQTSSCGDGSCSMDSEDCNSCPEDCSAGWGCCAMDSDGWYYLFYLQEISPGTMCCYEGNSAVERSGNCCPGYDYMFCEQGQECVDYTCTEIQKCGDGVCDASEDCSSCAKDCDCGLGDCCEPSSYNSDSYGCVSDEEEIGNGFMCCMGEEVEGNACIWYTVDNGRCETLLGETCENSPSDCACYRNECCSPESGNADGFGCVSSNSEISAGTYCCSGDKAKTTSCESYLSQKNALTSFKNQWARQFGTYYRPESGKYQKAAYFWDELAVYHKETSENFFKLSTMGKAVQGLNSITKIITSALTGNLLDIPSVLIELSEIKGLWNDSREDNVIIDRAGDFLAVLSFVDDFGDVQSFNRLTSNAREFRSFAATAKNAQLKQMATKLAEQSDELAQASTKGLSSINPSEVLSVNLISVAIDYSIIGAVKKNSKYDFLIGLQESVRAKIAGRLADLWALHDAGALTPGQAELIPYLEVKYFEAAVDEYDQFIEYWEEQGMVEKGMDLVLGTAFGEGLEFADNSKRTLLEVHGICFNMLDVRNAQLSRFERDLLEGL